MSKVYKLNIGNEIQGLIKLEEENDSYNVLKHIEVPPSNFGANSKNTAETATAFASLKSSELNSVILDI